MKKVAISIGDINGIGIEIMLKAHKIVESICEPIYCIDEELLNDAYSLLNSNIKIDKKNIYSLKDKYYCNNKPIINPGKITKESGQYSFDSFNTAINLALGKKVIGIVTLPINKASWAKAGINFVGHTDYLSHIFSKKGIMILGIEKMYVALFSDHIPLKDVPSLITKDNLNKFLLSLYESSKCTNALVLGLNPHAGDNGVLGKEDLIIKQAIINVNKIIGKDVFKGPISADSAFNKQNREKYNLFIAMYHDQGLAPLKALYFDESINVTLGLPILRTSVDHGVAFDIAYKNQEPNILSYINAVKYITKYK